MMGGPGMGGGGGGGQITLRMTIEKLAKVCFLKQPNFSVRTSEMIPKLLKKKKVP